MVGRSPAPCHSTPQLGLPPAMLPPLLGVSEAAGGGRVEGGLCTATASDAAPGVGPCSVHGPAAKASGFTPGWGAPALPLPTGAQRSLASEDRQSMCPPPEQPLPRSSPVAPHPPQHLTKLTAALSHDPARGCGHFSFHLSEPPSTWVSWASRPQSLVSCPSVAAPPTLTHLASSSRRGTIGSFSPCFWHPCPRPTECCRVSPLHHVLTAALPSCLLPHHH